MKRFSDFNAINIFSLELEFWEYELHTHNFYELLFIEKGFGIHHLNDLSFAYKAGDVFLLTPKDAHEFEISEKTIFTFIKFSDSYFMESFKDIKNNFSATLFNQILKNKVVINSSIVSQNSDVVTLFNLLSVIREIYIKKEAFHKEIVQGLFTSIIFLLEKEFQNSFSIEVNYGKEEKLQEILAFIRLNVVDSEKLKINYLATKFNISPNYLSVFLKHNIGMSLRKYCAEVKLKLAENLLKDSNLNINEIAEKLGFIDPSHFNKFFKKHKKINPSAFKVITKK
jgi:AraC family L-rhamnose operon regulatory protein RhaS